MAEHTNLREHSTAGLSPTRLEVTESLRAADLEKIDEILARPVDALDRPDLTGVPRAVSVEEANQEPTPAQCEDELDHVGLEEVENEVVTTATAATVKGIEAVREHHPSKWAGPTP